MSSNDALQKVNVYITPTVPDTPARWTRWQRHVADLPRGSDEVFPVSAGLDKRYRVIARLGQRTDTSDAEDKSLKNVR